MHTATQGWLSHFVFFFISFFFSPFLSFSFSSSILSSSPSLSQSLLFSRFSFFSFSIFEQKRLLPIRNLKPKTLKFPEKRGLPVCNLNQKTPTFLKLALDFFQKKTKIAERQSGENSIIINFWAKYQKIADQKKSVGR